MIRPLTAFFTMSCQYEYNLHLAAKERAIDRPKKQDDRIYTEIQDKNFQRIRR